MFVVIKKKTIGIILLFVLLATAGAAVGLLIKRDATSAADDRVKVVIDAGHGGIDGGVVGKNGTVEADINLAVAKETAKIFESKGYAVVMTRTDGNGLYGDAEKGRKQKDMAARKKIIEDSGAAMVISIHGNRFPDSSRRGAQVFFDEFNKEGKSLADAVQAKLNAINAEKAGREYAALKGDYYILKCTENPSIIVECGFLSNPKDEELLNDEGYRKSLAEAVASGAEEYFKNKKA